MARGRRGFVGRRRSRSGGALPPQGAERVERALEDVGGGGAVDVIAEIIVSSNGSLQDLVLRRARDALEAGCDVVLHCNGRMDEMRAVAAAAGPARPPR